MTRLLQTLTLVFLLACTATCIAEDRTGKILLLHTNDIHARLKPNDSGQGGLPYVAAYVQQVRQNRRDVLLLDAGDVLAKGNMVSWMTQGRVMYEAMNQIGYDAGVPGNHDFAYGADQLRANMRTATFPLLCANPTLEVTMQPSAVININGVRVGVIGMTLLSPAALEESKALLGREAKRLEQETDLLIALCHLNSKTCLALADAVPEIDVFVSGHSHEVLSQPIVATGSGARIVQAGSLARYVGHWELTVDLDSKRLVGCQGRLVLLPHDTSARREDDGLDHSTREASLSGLRTRRWQCGACDPRCGSREVVWAIAAASYRCGCRAKSHVDAEGPDLSGADRFGRSICDVRSR